jgi:hypothetical protein
VTRFAAAGFRPPEAYFNQAILAQEYQAKESEGAAVPMLKKASRLYQEFVTRAGADPALSEAVERARERRSDIEATLVFIGKTKP